MLVTLKVENKSLNITWNKEEQRRMVTLFNTRNLFIMCKKKLYIVVLLNAAHTQNIFSTGITYITVT